MTLHPQYITNSSGQKHAVVLPIKEYNLLLNKLEELEDTHLYDTVKAQNEPSVSFEQYLKKRKTKNNNNFFLCSTCLLAIPVRNQL